MAVAHGQMDEASLETIVMEFWDGRYDVLVCTTIIESGIDMPTVNTLVVDRAEFLGLGQLHQLRGRVGRSGQRAYAYLFTRPKARSPRRPTNDCARSVMPLNLVPVSGSPCETSKSGGRQPVWARIRSGHIAAVGYDLYCEMVNEAVNELNGVETTPPVEVKIDLPVDALIPDDYIPGGSQRLEAYRRLSAVTTSPRSTTSPSNGRIATVLFPKLPCSCSMWLGFGRR